MIGTAGRPRDLDRVVDASVAASAEQPSIRERRQAVGMPRTDPRAFTALGDACEPCPAGAWVARPAGGLIPARILNPRRRPENRAHRSGVAIPVAVGAASRRADVQTCFRDDRIEAVRRSMAPDHGRVTGALGAGKAGIDDLEQVGHRSSQAVCSASLPRCTERSAHSPTSPALWRRRAGRSSAAGSRAWRYRAVRRGRGGHAVACAALRQRRCLSSHRWRGRRRRSRAARPHHGGFS